MLARMGMLLVKMSISMAMLEINVKVCHKLKLELSYDPAVPLHQKECDTHPPPRPCLAALPTAVDCEISTGTQKDIRGPERNK